MSDTIKKIIIGLSVFLVCLPILSACDGNKPTDTDSFTDSNVSSESDSVSDVLTSNTDTEENNQPVDVMFKEYFNNELIKKYGKTKENVTDSRECSSGMSGAYICDLDGDGNEEMVTVRSFGSDNTELAVDIYRVENDKVKFVCSVIDDKETYSTVYANNEIFLVKNDSGYYICSKLYFTEDESGVPSTQRFVVYEYKNGKALALTNLEYVEKSSSSIEIVINDTIVYRSDADEHSNTAYLSLEKAADALTDELSAYNLAGKIYCEKSGNDIIALTFHGSNKKDNEISLCYRQKDVEYNSKDVKIQFISNFFGENE